MLVEVAVPLPVFGRFTWSTESVLAPGATVLVPFGPREVVGWVVGPGAEVPGVELRPLRAVLDPEPAFDEDQLAFYRWIAEYYLCPLGEVIGTATPADTGHSTRRVYHPTPEGIERLAIDPPEGPRGAVLREVVARPGIARSALERRLHGEVEHAGVHLGALVQAGLVAGEDKVVSGVRDEVVWVVPTGPPSTRLGPRASEVLARLPALVSDLPAGVVSTLVKAGAAARERRPRLAPASHAAASLPPSLNGAQCRAVEGGARVGVHLLHGVTGSGKTEVYLALTDRALAQAGQALVLVPEIALTPQLTSRFEARFPGRVAVLHSGLAAGEKLREWRRIRAGEADVVIGARSAVFAPFRALRLVVVDEEHDDSYKQDDGVRYHGRDLAVVRAARARCPCVLGSATPSLESWRNVQLGRYSLLQLLERATPSAVPRLELVDMRPLAKAAEGKPPLLAPEVDEAVRAALAEGGKAILLHNRRGYATFVECAGCGQSYDCPSCGVALVYHQAIARLDCHYCGFHRKYPGSCAQCGIPLQLLGKGTERIEEQLTALFPEVPVGRMDADTTRGKGAHARILDAFRAGRTRLLIGTQLVAKGHDFPDVHVAAVLGADHILGMPDFRSAERTWALVTQLCGRAGRGSVAGRVFVQTQHPEHPIFSCIGDMEAFASAEMDLRRMLNYPPYSSMVLMRLEGADRGVAREAAVGLVRQMRREASAFGGVDVLGPAAAPLPKLVGRYRFQVVLRARDRARFRRFLQAHHLGWKAPAGIRRILDIDPRSMM